MMDEVPWREWYWRAVLLEGRGPDWPTLLGLFVAAGFFFLPGLLGYALSFRARFCFMAAAVLLLVNLGIGLIRLSIVQFEVFSRVVDDRPPPRPFDDRPPRERFDDGRPLPRASAPRSAFSLVVQLFLPVLQAAIYIVALLFFLIGLPGQVRRKQPLEV